MEEYKERVKRTYQFLLGGVLNDVLMAIEKLPEPEWMRNLIKYKDSLKEVFLSLWSWRLSGIVGNTIKEIQEIAQVEEGVRDALLFLGYHGIVKNVFSAERWERNPSLDESILYYLDPDFEAEIELTHPSLGEWADQWLPPETRKFFESERRKRTKEDVEKLRVKWGLTWRFEEGKLVRLNTISRA